MNLPLTRLWDRQFCQYVDSVTQQNVPASTLMERAGKAVAKHTLGVAQELGIEKIIIFAGSGNNGGDGLVAANILADTEQFKVRIFKVEEESAIPWQEAIFKDSLVIDALLGIGFSGPLKEGNYKNIIQKGIEFGLKDKVKKIIAVDLPSGMDCNAQQAENFSWAADITLTFGGFKPCHRIAPWRGRCGEVICYDIGFSEEAITAGHQHCQDFVTLESRSSRTTPHPFDSLSQDAHKFDRGHVLVIGGSAGKMGAPILSALAAYRSGAGWVSLAMPTDPTKGPSVPAVLTTEPFFHNQTLDFQSLQNFIHDRKVRSIILGPGTVASPLDQKAAAFFAEATQEGIHLCLDAAATQQILKFFKKTPCRPHFATALPHPGEWSRLDGDLVFQNDPSFWQKWAIAEEATGIALVYKSATPQFLNSNNQPLVASHGTSALSKAGTGDVLSGIVGAFALQLKNPAERISAALNHFHHAADLAQAKRSSPHSLLASDLIDTL